jgi:hypothetical protein
MGLLLHDSEALGLRFDSHQDALNYAAELVQSSRDWLAINDLDVVKRYKKGELEVVLECRSRPEFNKYHLVFRSVPYVGRGHGEKSSTRDVYSVWPKCLSNGNDHLMFIGVGDFVQCPQEIISSSVRLETAKERVDFFRNILGSPQCAWHVGNASSEGERAVFGLANAGSRSKSVPSIIEGTPQGDHDVGSSIGDTCWDFLRHPDFFQRMSRLFRVQLSNSLVGVLVVEDFEFPLEIDKVFLSPCELLTRTGESI